MYGLKEETIMEKTDITVIILTKNEEKNLETCLRSIEGFAKRVLVVDSGSTDRTIEIAKSFGAEVIEHEFESYAHQYNWVLENCKINTGWVLRLDADEIVTDKLKEEIAFNCKKHSLDNVNGFVVKFKIYFLNKLLKHAGNYPFYNMIVWKTGFGKYTERYMGEHSMLTEGTTIKLKNYCIHNDVKDVDTFIAKHNWYATREILDYLDLEKNKNNKEIYEQAKKTQGLRDRVYYKLPMFFRAKLYYIYRYYLKLGFLDGKAGKIYCLIQAYFYRVMVDAKIYEAKRNSDSINKKPGSLK